MKNVQCHSSKLIDSQVKDKYNGVGMTLKEIVNVVFNVVIQVLILQESNFRMTLTKLISLGSTHIYIYNNKNSFMFNNLYFNVISMLIYYNTNTL